MHTHYCRRCGHAYFCSLRLSVCRAPSDANHAFNPCPPRGPGMAGNTARPEQPRYTRPDPHEKYHGIVG